MTKAFGVAMIAAGALALSACSKSPPPPEGANIDNAAIANSFETLPPDETNALPPVENTANASNAVAAEPPKISEDEQMRDDADATGMTARIDSESTGEAGNATENVR